MLSTHGPTVQSASLLSQLACLVLCHHPPPRRHPSPAWRAASLLTSAQAASPGETAAAPSAQPLSRAASTPTTPRAPPPKPGAPSPLPASLPAPRLSLTSQFWTAMDTPSPGAPSAAITYNLWRTPAAPVGTVVTHQTRMRPRVRWKAQCAARANGTQSSSTSWTTSASTSAAGLVRSAAHAGAPRVHAALCSRMRRTRAVAIVTVALCATPSRAPAVSVRLESERERERERPA